MIIEILILLTVLGGFGSFCWYLIHLFDKHLETRRKEYRESEKEMIRKIWDLDKKSDDPATGRSVMNTEYFYVGEDK